jgi:hypothetical protein
MTLPLHGAAARRDSRLLRIRKLTLWITGGAAAASLGLGTAFAHAVPGHSYTTASTATTGGTPSSGQAEPRQQAGSQKTPGQQPATHQRVAGPRGQQGGRRATARPQHQRLAPPRQAPAPAPATAAPAVSSGGS